MSSRVFQGVIVQMKEATDRTVGVVNAEGTVVASSELSIIGSKLPGAAEIVEASAEQVLVHQGNTYKALSSLNGQIDYAVFVEGEDELAKCGCIMAGVAFCEAKAYYEEKYDKATFMKNIISDNILPGDIYVRAKELCFTADVPRAVFLIRQIDGSDVDALEVVQKMFPDKQKDFVLSISATDIALIKELSVGADIEVCNKLAIEVQEALKNELGIKTVIGIGSISNYLRELADKYKEAQIAIEVGKVFDTAKSIINYENLGIGRLIYQLPTTLCEMFLSEVFKKNPIDALDQETLYTINKFFENNLNVSETSRKLFVHRNTLVYRLEKIKKLTGLDLREFDHAIVFKVALMVKKYLHSHEGQY